jgi:hypothetical protein
LDRYRYHLPGLLIGLYIVTGLGLASWTQLVVVWFKDASTLAAIFSKFDPFSLQTSRTTS